VNTAIREWIEAQCQPWRTDPTSSTLGGVIGSASAQVLGADFLTYFGRQGVALEGRTYEQVMEDELLRVFDQITSWLTTAERDRIDQHIAFGIAFTQQPNAYAVSCLGGYAVLLDLAIDPVLIGETELMFASFVPPVTLDSPSFTLSFNATIVSLFFRKAPFWSPIPDEGFAHRFRVNRWVWMMSVFVLSHELGHVLCGHLDGSAQRRALITTVGGDEPYIVLNPTYSAEFEADEFALDLMMREGKGAAEVIGAEPATFWNAAYMALSLLFTVFEATEILAGRLGITLPDTHPPAAKRWSRVLQKILQRMPVEKESINFALTIKALAIHTASDGPLPDISSGPEAMFPSVAILGEWLSTDTPMRSRAFLKEHPELLGPATDHLLEDLASSKNSEAAHVRSRVMLPILRRARAVGIDPAFDEWLFADAPEAKPESFDVPMHELSAMNAAIGAEDMARVEELRRSSRALDAFMNLRHSVNLLLTAGGLGGIRAVIAGHPELLHPTADRVLSNELDLQQSAEAKRRLEFLRDLLCRARETGLARAVHEIDRFFGTDLHAQEIT
jgi:hypothetical protein